VHLALHSGVTADPSSSTPPARPPPNPKPPRVRANGPPTAAQERLAGLSREWADIRREVQVMYALEGELVWGVTVGQ
jgi:hypothetical protein